MVKKPEFELLCDWIACLFVRTKKGTIMTGVFLGEWPLGQPITEWTDFHQPGAWISATDVARVTNLSLLHVDKAIQQLEHSSDRFCLEKEWFVTHRGLDELSDEFEKRGQKDASILGHQLGQWWIDRSEGRTSWYGPQQKSNDYEAADVGREEMSGKDIWDQ